MLVFCWVKSYLETNWSFFGTILRNWSKRDLNENNFVEQFSWKYFSSSSTFKENSAWIDINSSSSLLSSSDGAKSESQAQYSLHFSLSIKKLENQILEKEKKLFPLCREKNSFSRFSSQSETWIKHATFVICVARGSKARNFFLHL